MKEAVGRTWKTLWTYSAGLRYGRSWIWTWQRCVLPRLPQHELRSRNMAQQQVDTSLFFRWSILAQFPQPVTELSLERMALSIAEGYSSTFSMCSGWPLSFSCWDSTHDSNSISGKYSQCILKYVEETQEGWPGGDSADSDERGHWEWTEVGKTSCPLIPSQWMLRWQNMSYAGIFPSWD